MNSTTSSWVPLFAKTPTLSPDPSQSSLRRAIQVFNLKISYYSLFLNCDTIASPQITLIDTHPPASPWSASQSWLLGHQADTSFAEWSHPYSLPNTFKNGSTASHSSSPFKLQARIVMSCWIAWKRLVSVQARTPTLSEASELPTSLPTVVGKSFIFQSDCRISRGTPSLGGSRWLWDRGRPWHGGIRNGYLQVEMYDFVVQYRFWMVDNWQNWGFLKKLSMSPSRFFLPPYYVWLVSLCRLLFRIALLCSLFRSLCPKWCSILLSRFCLSGCHIPQVILMYHSRRVHVCRQIVKAVLCPVINDSDNYYEF